jgi:hypothetical protein
MVSRSLGGTQTEVPLKAAGETAESEWECSLSTSTYFVQNSRDYANPTLVADHDWLHLDARYNYEAIKTGSVWLGYNFSLGKKLVLEATPMLGGVLGDITGMAPGYILSLSYEQIEFFTQGEYFFDAGTRSGNFFYSWSELSYAPVTWFRAGIVIDRTKALGSNFEVRRGPLVVGFNVHFYRSPEFLIDGAGKRRHAVGVGLRSNIPARPSATDWETSEKD